jgi:serine/threonine-protein kinase
MDRSGTRVGTEIAGFRVESVLGRGGTSVVYLAEQTRLGRKVALKVLVTGSLEGGDQFRDRFLRESYLAASLDHPNIIPIYDAGEADGCLFIAMRYVEGRDLGQILQAEGALGLGRTLFILDQVAGALDAAHEHGLVHRDVKPANVLLVGDTDRAYLTDFGVAKPTTSSGLTRTGIFIGTPDYSTPEQIEGREVDARTDVYSLGAVLYSSLTGLAPYARTTEMGVLQAHLLEPPPKVRDSRPELPRALDRVISTAMAKAKEDRYPTCGDLLLAAEAAAHEREHPAALRSRGETVDARRHETADLPPSPAPGAAGTDGEPVPSAPAPESTPAPVAALGAEQAPPSPPAPPASAATEGEGSRRRSVRGGQLLVGLLAAAVVALGAALLAVLVTRGDHNSSAGAVGAGGTSFRVPLKSSAEVPAAIGGTSSGSAEVTVDRTKVCWQFQLTGVEGPNFAHIHRGGPTVSGPVVVPLGGTYSSSGCTSANASVTAAILDDPAGYYVNVHTARFPDGAVRGQLAPAQGAPPSTVREVGLAALIPKPVYGGCKLRAKPIAGAVQTAECVPPAGAGQHFYPDHLELSTFATDAALRRAYAAESKAADVGSDFGRCDGSSWLGEGPWYHAPETAGRPGKPGGRRLCYFDGNVAVVVWTHEKFGQATHVNFLGIARKGGSDHPDLYNWWRFWTHRLGKCLQEGCTASPG